MPTNQESSGFTVPYLINETDAVANVYLWEQQHPGS